MKEELSLLTRFLLIQQGRPDLIKLNDAIGKYEFSAIPQHLFDSNGVIHVPHDKSDFMTEIEACKNTLDDLPNQVDSFDNVEFTVTIIDVMVKVHSLSKGAIKTGKDYGDAFVSLVDCFMKNSNKGIVIFDRYLNVSLKDVTRKKRSANIVPIRYKITDEMDLTHI